MFDDHHAVDLWRQLDQILDSDEELTPAEMEAFIAARRGGPAEWEAFLKTRRTYH